jgi:glucokinase
MQQSTYHACVDIGGTKVAVSLADSASQSSLQLHARRTEPTAKEGSPSALAEQIIRMIDAACAEHGIAPQQIASVAVSSCGPFVLQGDMLALAAPNICGGLGASLVGGVGGVARGLPNDWTSAPLEAPLRQRYGAVRVENDAIGALEAERRWGALQGSDHCAYVTWSTGIGVGLCVDGRVLRGKNGNAGHAGHMFVSSHPDAACGCGNRGDLEAVVAGNAIPRRFGQGAAALFEAASAGDTLAAAHIDELCQVMGRALYNLIVTLDLQRISLGGSVFWHHHEMLLPRLRAEVAGKLAALTDGCDIVPAGLGLRVGDLAALALVEVS